MWKDFFYYSKSERRSILVLSGIGILLLVSGTYIQSVRQESAPLVDSLSIDSFCVRSYQKHATDSLKWKHRVKVSRRSPILADFDPNTADSATFCRLGLPPFMAKRILNYRSKGGVFHKKEDFARIYGLSREQYRQLEPYIIIDEHSVGGRSQQLALDNLSTDNSSQTSMQRNNFHTTDAGKDSMNHQFVKKTMKYPKGTILDLNAADTTELKRIPGIGSGLAKMIVAYRNRLGGYAHVNQLQEVAQIDTVVNNWFKIDSCIYRPLRVNHARLDQLRNHPYMNFYKAKVILEFRRKRGKIKGLSQLSMFQEFTEKDLQRLKPYLDFE